MGSEFCALFSVHALYLLHKKLGVLGALRSLQIRVLQIQRKGARPFLREEEVRLREGAN
jgi:hypothetical protein